MSDVVVCHCSDCESRTQETYRLSATDHHSDGVRLALAHARISTLEAEVDRLRSEIAVDDKLLADRDALLREFPCPLHGPCIPYLRWRLSPEDSPDA